MKNKMLKTLESFNNKPLILSVSGGVDSLVLFDLLLKTKHELIVVHFNHLTRPEAYDEAKHVKELCLKNNIKYHYFELNIDPSTNFHNKAHNLRKEHLIEVANLYNTNVIITAHHLNDLAESVLLKLSRGSNLLGYAGMTEIHYKEGYYYVKPLLSFPKEIILKYAQENNVVYYEDISNLTDDYTRNKIRHHVIPYLIEENPTFLNKVIQYNETLIETFSFIRNQAISFLNNKDYFMVDDFKKLNIVIQKEVISYLLENNSLDLSLNKINGLLNFIKNSGPNNSFNVGSNYIFLKEYNKVILTKFQEKISFRQQLFLDKENVLPDGTIIKFNNTYNEMLNNSIVLCYNKLVMPLWARTRQKGDILYFSYGHKKLKNFFIDNKIPKSIRDSSIIITDNNNQILAILGLYTNNNPKLDNKIQLTFERK